MEKVAILKCETYDLLEVKNKLEASFDYLGGISNYFKKGERVLLKLNLLMKRRPEEATTTHPIFVQALAELLSEQGCIVLVADSPGGPFNEKKLKGIYEVCGMGPIEEIENVSLNKNFGFFEKKNPGGKILKKITLVDFLNDVDKVISVSKLKTHSMTTFTGAVKNMFGIVPGTLKVEYHFKMPEIKDFSDALVDICLAGKPVFSFMDGIVGMEGAGPSAGTPKKVGAIIASTSPYHLDRIAVELIDLDYKKVPTIQRCIERGLCRGDLSDIELHGEKIEDMKVEGFQIPETRSVHFVKNQNSRLFRKISDEILKPKPIFDYDICVGCGDCAENCPPKIIKMENGKPNADLKHCIRCFCCQELCPVRAVHVHRTWLSKVMLKF